MLSAAPLAAAPNDSPSATVTQLLDGWRAGDFDKASAALAPQFRLLTLRKGERGPDLQVEEREQLVQAMRKLKAGAWDVRLGAIQQNRDASGIATVWAPYTFYLNGKKSHCGIEAYTLYRLESGWKIVSFSDTHLWQGIDARCVDRALSRKASAAASATRR